MVQDKAIITIKHYLEVICTLSDVIISNDLE